MKKVLKYETLDSYSSGALVRITEQSHRTTDFGVMDSEFKASNGVTLISNYCPEFNDNGHDDMVVYVQGANTGNDHYILVFPDEHQYRKFTDAVSEYNQFEFSAGVPIETVKKVHKVIVEHMKDHMESLHDLLDWESNIKNAEDLMDWKKRVMLATVRSLPLLVDHCVYCIHNDYDHVFQKACVDCDYGKKKGLCCNPDSTYMQIKDAADLLLDRIRDYAN